MDPGPGPLTCRTCLLSLVCSRAETVAKEMPGLISMGTSESASWGQTQGLGQARSVCRRGCCPSALSQPSLGGSPVIQCHKAEPFMVITTHFLF